MAVSTLVPRRRGRAVYRSGDRVQVVRTATGIAPFAAAPAVTVSALPRIVDLELYQGDDFYLAVVVSDPDGTPADLTGAVPLSQLRIDPEHEDIMASFAPTIIGNVVYLHLDHTQASGLRGALVWDAQITQAGRVTTLCAGRVSVTPEVTR